MGTSEFGRNERYTHKYLRFVKHFPKKGRDIDVYRPKSQVKPPRLKNMSHSISINKPKPKPTCSSSPNDSAFSNPNSVNSVSGSPVRNSNITELENDYLYHFDIDTKLDLPALFGTVNVVITAGDQGRIEKLAQKLHQKYEVQEELRNLTHGGGRFGLYCVEHVLLFNHGMGSGSCSIAFHEIFKLLHYAKVDRNTVKFIRIGTCGGVGVEPGTICFTEKALTETLDSLFPFVECGKVYPVPMILSEDLTGDLKEIADRNNYPCTVGKTLGTNDFYLGQGRLDGAFCTYNEHDKFSFLYTLQEMGVKNIEMESHTFGAFCTRAKIQGAVMCVAILNRLKHDQIESTADERREWINRALDVLVEFCLQKRL